VTIDSENSGIRIRSSGTSGVGWRDWCRTSHANAANPHAIAAAAVPACSPSVSMPSTIRPSARPLSSAPPRSNGRGCGSLGGASRRKAIAATMQIGTLTRNSQGQRANDRMAAATDGPAAPENDTVRATSARALPMRSGGWMRAPP